MNNFLQRTKDAISNQQNALNRALNNAQDKKSTVSLSQDDVESLKAEVFRLKQKLKGEDLLVEEIEHLKNELHVAQGFQTQNEELKAQISKMEQQMQATQSVEVQPQLQSPIRDREKEQQLELEISALKDQLHQVIEHSGDDREKLAALELEVLFKDKEVASLQAQVGQLRQANDNKRDQPQELNQSGSQVDSKLAEQIESLKQEVNSLQRSLDDKDREHSLSISQKVQEQHEAMDLLEKDVIAQEQLKLDASKKETEKIKAQLAEKEQQLQIVQVQYKSQLQLLQSQNEQLLADISDMNNRVESMQETIHSLESKNSDLVRELELLQEQYQLNQSKLQSQEEENCLIKDNLDEANGKASQMAAAIADLEDQLQKSQNLQEQLQSQVQALQNEVKALNSDCKMKTQQVLKAETEAQNKEQLYKDAIVEKLNVQQKLDDTVSLLEQADAEIKALSLKHEAEMIDYKEQVAKSIQTLPKDDVGTLQLKVAKLQRDLKSKSKLILQYALKESKLQQAQEAKVEAKLKQSHDVQSLTEINHKMQNVLGEITQRNFELEEEVRGMKDLIRRASNRPLEKSLKKQI